MRNPKELGLIALFCFAAATRVFIFSAGFPFFSNIDEDLHFDLIIQYSHAQLPQNFDSLKQETLDWIVPNASPEFLYGPDRFPGGKFPLPLWKQSGPAAETELALTRAGWSTETNSESSQPPLYYLLGAAWWRLGRLVGFTGIRLLYWLRFLNVPLIALVVWLSYFVAREVAPERGDLRIGVPLLVASIPQSVFYTINNDVLSPICGAALFLLLLQWLRLKTVGVVLGALTGLAIAAMYLTKLSNLPLIGVALAVIAARALTSLRHQPRPLLAALAALIVSAAIPIGGWMIWTKYQFGDLTGSATKFLLLGWTRKAFPDWWHHPIFSARGFWTFWSDLISNFWRGEVWWQGRPLDWPIANGFFAVSSLLILFGVACFGLIKTAEPLRFQRQAIAVALLSFAAAVGFLAFLSIQFDFGNCINPSRAHPYFTSGRLLNGALIPFALVYVYGLHFFLHRINSILPMVVLVLIVAFATTAEILVDRLVFASQHNWFHL